MPETVKIIRNGPIFEVTLDRPKANAIDEKTSQLLSNAFIEFRDTAEFRVAILTGGGERFFSAGWDLKAAADGEGYESDYGEGGFGGFTELPNLNKPVIVAVNGMAVGGGFELAMAADLVVAADTASFWLGEIFVGVIPDAGTVRLPRMLPKFQANELLLTGRRLMADEAQTWGLVNAVVPQVELMNKAREYANTIVTAAPIAIAAIKELVRDTDGLSLESAFSHMRSGKSPYYNKMMESSDAIEGPRAFSEKRDPVWTGK